MKSILKIIYQISNIHIKYKIWRNKIKIFNTLFVFFIFFILYLISPVQNVHAAITYPIKELGNCRNARECYLYCQIPGNSPACWSYGKYRLSSSVLGEETRPAKEFDKLSQLSYPISELGNCASKKECFDYCANPINHNTCISFGKIHALTPNNLTPTPKLSSKIISVAIEELGCDSSQSCLAICGQPSYKAICQSFAQKYHLQSETKPKKINTSILAAAKSTLGCDSEESCKTFCSKAENVSKCMEFGKVHKLAQENSLNNQNKTRLLEDAKQSLGCTTFEGCAAFCSQAQNVEKCMTFSKNYATGSSNSKVPAIKSCANKTECKSYCENHPSECPGFNSTIKNSDYLGPGGCRTEAECKAYCENHPTDCPAYPVSKE